MYQGVVEDINMCKSKCDITNECVSFEYWGTSNPHHNYGAGYCQASSSCTYELSEYSETDNSGPNCHLYVKSGRLTCVETPKERTYK